MMETDSTGILKSIFGWIRSSPEISLSPQFVDTTDLSQFCLKLLFKSFLIDDRMFRLASEAGCINLCQVRLNGVCKTNGGIWSSFGSEQVVVRAVF